MAQENRIALISIIVEDREQSGPINTYLHEYSDFIIGRMGIPRPERGISIISVALDAPQDKISALSGKLGALAKVSTKTTYSTK